jgi:hypothetical protein
VACAFGDLKRAREEAESVIQSSPKSEQAYQTHNLDFLDLWSRRRQRSSFDLRLESNLAVTAIAKRLVLGMPAAAERDDLSASEVERIPLNVVHCKISLYFERTVVIDDNLGIWH